MKQLVAFVMIAFLVPATATVAFAKNPCKEDKAKFCKDAKAAGKKIADCLKEHSAELTPACKEFARQAEGPGVAKRRRPRRRPRRRQKARRVTSPQATSRQRTKPAETKPAEGATPAACRPGSTRRRRDQAVTIIPAVPHDLKRHGVSLPSLCASMTGLAGSREPRQLQRRLYRGHSRQLPHLCVRGREPDRVAAELLRHEISHGQGLSRHSGQSSACRQGTARAEDLRLAFRHRGTGRRGRHVP